MGLRGKLRDAFNASKEGSAFTALSVDTHEAAWGIKILSYGKSPIVDIIFIHGLTGHRDRTWTAPGAIEPWPKTLLPTDIPNARILTYGYDAAVVHWTKVAGQNTTREHALNLVNDLCNYRTRTKSNRRPIVFVVHSLGGLVIQDALLLCANPSDEAQAAILNWTRGICFLGTPNAGSDFAKFANAVANVISLSFMKSPNAHLLEILESRSQILADIKNGFLTMVRRRVEEGFQAIRLHAFVEELPVTATGHRVVTPDSAVIPGYNSSTIPENHMNMTKFSKTDDVGYERILGKLMDWVMAIKETSESFTSPYSRQTASHLLPYEEAPNDLKLGDKSYYRYPKRSGKIIDRPNVMGQITDLLKRDCMKNTRIAVLYGMGGQGKTMLAINYCRQAETKHLFLSIFWIDASSEDTLQKDLVTISDVVKRSEDQLFESPEARIEFTLRRIEEWNRPWLLVIDNYDDPGRLPNLTSYMPNSAQGSILITSRQANLNRLGAVVEVPPMSKEEALLLLYDRSGGADKFKGEDHHAAKIVELLGYLPLAIDQAGAYIQRRVDLSLSRFVEEYGNRKDSVWSQAPKIWDYKAPVYTTWEMSFELIDEDEDIRDKKGKILTMLSFLDSQNISEEIFKVPRSLVNPAVENTLETPNWLQLLLKTNGEWDLLKLEDLLTDFKDLSLLQLFASKSGTLHLSLHPLVSEWVKYRADLETKQQCLDEAILIVEMCLKSKVQSATKPLLSVEAEQQIYRHQVSCIENLQELCQRNLALNSQPSFSEPSAPFGKDITTTQHYREAIQMLQQRNRELHARHQLALSDQEYQQGQAILNWLSQDDSKSIQANLMSRTAEGTGQWFIHSKDFEAWLSHDYRFLWGVGTPGSGKSVIVSQVIRHLTQTQNDATCLFFFCDYRSKNNYLKILCSILRQAIDQLGSTPLEIQRSFVHHTEFKSQLDCIELNYLLFSIIRLLARKVYIVIDAVDWLEVDGRRKLLDAINQLADSFPSSVNIMITSRADAYSGNILTDVRIIQIRPRKEDVSTFVKARLNSGHLARLLDRVPELKSEAIEAIVCNSNDSMLLAQLSIDHLSQKVTRKGIALSVKSLSTSLDDIYKESIRRIKGQSSEKCRLGMQILMWLYYAKTLFRPRELQHALFSMGLEPKETDFDDGFLIDLELITSSCAGLVSVDEEVDTVRLVHFSVKEYFDGEKDRLFPNATNEIIRSCIRYLSLDAFNVGLCPETAIRDRMLKYPFAAYAAQYWIQYEKQSGEELADEVVEEVVAFLKNEATSASWIQILRFVEGQAQSKGEGDRETQSALSERLVKCKTPMEMTEELGLSTRVRAHIGSKGDGTLPIDTM